MRKILPQYGMQFIEIPRKKQGDVYISASEVRRLASENKFDEIKDLVPQKTLDYLRKSFSKKDI